VVAVLGPHAARLPDLVVTAVADRGSTAALRTAPAELGVGLDYRPEVH
jgi:hypothetical protein